MIITFSNSVAEHENVILCRLDYLEGEVCLWQMSLRDNSSCAKLVGLGGFEPPTSPLSGVRSNQLSYRPGIYQTRSAPSRDHSVLMAMFFT